MRIILVHCMIHVDHVLVVDDMIINHVFGLMENVHYHQIHWYLIVVVHHWLIKFVLWEFLINILFFFQKIKPMNMSVNTERALLKITGVFEGVKAHFVKVMVEFPLANQSQFLCNIETIQNDRFLLIRENFMRIFLL